MTAMLGALSMVVDAGVYFVIQRQLQNAADAAALAAVWYDPACPSGNPSSQSAGCQHDPPAGPVPPTCGSDIGPCTAANQVASANQTVALSLCAGPTAQGKQLPPPEVHPGAPLNVPQVSTYVVTMSCDAPHWFGQVLPGVIKPMHIQVSAAAALGWLGQNGQLLGGPTPPSSTTPLVARLII